MSTYAYLCVGDLIIASYRNEVPTESLSFFRDDMLALGSVPACEYYPEEEYPHGVKVDLSYRAPGVQVVTAVYSCPTSVAAERLNLMGATREASLGFLDFRLGEMAVAGEDPTTSTDWLRVVPSAPEEWDNYSPKRGSKQYLLDFIAGETDVEERYLLRCAIEAFPQAMVTLDVTDLNAQLCLEDRIPLESMASRAAESIRKSTTDNVPVVVLTEGKTDAEFLSCGLQVLYPHLTDLIRFLDFDQRPEGGSGALVRMIRSFGAAGIANRVVAVLDNDTAAADALRVLDRQSLPGNIRVLQYPAIGLASSYPTLGPPMLGSTADSINLSDVNGLAGSIEIYLGEDVLRQPGGALRPVQWRSYISGMHTYQGEVTDKDSIQREFRAKSAAALADPAVTGGQDWEGIRVILDAIQKAAQLALHPQLLPLNPEDR